MAGYPWGPYITKVFTASGTVTTAGVGGYVKAFGMTVLGNPGQVQLKDGGSGGTVGPELKLDGATAKNSISSGDIGPVRFDTDVYININGTNVEGWVIYSQDTE